MRSQKWRAQGCGPMKRFQCRDSIIYNGTIYPLPYGPSLIRLQMLFIIACKWDNMPSIHRLQKDILNVTIAFSYNHSPRATNDREKWFKSTIIIWTGYDFTPSLILYHCVPPWSSISVIYIPIRFPKKLTTRSRRRGQWIVQSCS